VPTGQLDTTEPTEDWGLTVPTDDFGIVAWGTGFAYYWGFTAPTEG